MRSIVQLVCLVTWVYGIVLAKGVLSTIVSVIFPLWAWYLVVEHIVIVNGWL